MQCRKCGEIKKSEEFRKIGGGKRDTLCKKCFNAYQLGMNRRKGLGMYRVTRAAETERICSKCGVTKPIERFRLRKDKTHSWRGSVCMDCVHAKQRGMRNEKASTIVVTEKKCYRCRQILSVDDFHRNKTQQDGYADYCKACQAGMGHARIERLRTKFMEYKKGLKCEKCGEGDSNILVFHHSSRNEKEYDVSSMYCSGPGWDKIKKEIDNCIVLCANCHRKLHHPSPPSKGNRVYTWGLKEGKACKICGEDYYACLDFHHSDPSTKSFGINKINNIKGMTKELALQEVAKCDVLCRNCHSKLHAAEGRTWAAPSSRKKPYA